MGTDSQDSTAMSDQLCGGKLRGWGQSCRRQATVERDGRHYCGTHDPVARKARQEERDTAWRARYDAETRARAAQRERERFNAVVGDLARAAGATTEDLAAGRVRVTVSIHGGADEH